MSGFSTILQDPEFRRIVDDNVIASKAWNGLMSMNLFRKEVAASEAFGSQIGDRKSFTGEGRMPVKAAPVAPGVDAPVGKYPVEQWDARLSMYTGSIDTHMPTVNAAAYPRLIRDMSKAAENAGESINRAARNKLFNAGFAGHTVVSGAVTASTSVPVKRLAGFCRARRPDLAAGEPVRYDAVSTSNPLRIQIFDNSAAYVEYSVVAATPTNAGDEFGPGTLTLSAVVTCSDRAVCRAIDRSTVVRSGGGDKVDSLSTSDAMTLADVRLAMTAQKNANTPKFADGTHHLHCDATQMGHLFADTEFKGLMESRGLTPGEPYAEFMVKRAMGVSFYECSECPQTWNVVGGGASYSTDDLFGGELFADGTTGAAVHRALLISADAFYEYYIDDPFISQAHGLLGNVRFAQEVNATQFDLAIDNVLMFLKPPATRVQTDVSTTWRFIGDWCVRTDGAVNQGGSQRYKRVSVIESGATS